jgi:membrane dipeptidase
MFIVDAHQDIAYNTICFNRDYRVSALQKRRLEAGTEIPRLNGNATTGLPEAIAGRVALVFATIFTAPDSGNASSPWAAVMYKTPQEAHRLGVQQVDVYQRLVDEDERLRLVRDASDLDAVLATWDDEVPVQERVQGLVLLMENGDPIREPQEFEAWIERGVRIVGPAWLASRYCGGTGMPGPLTDLGRELLEVMAEFNTVLDLSHMAEAAYLEALDRYPGPIIASHSNPRLFCDTDRHLSDEMIRRLAERDGVMGVVLYNVFLNEAWRFADGKSAIPLTRVLDVIDYVCQVTGSAAHVGLGSDFDGGFGTEAIPAELDTVADLWQFKEGLEGRGFATDDVAAILGGNMLRKLREGLASS